MSSFQSSQQSGDFLFMLPFYVYDTIICNQNVRVALLLFLTPADSSRLAMDLCAYFEFFFMINILIFGLLAHKSLKKAPLLHNNLRNIINFAYFSHCASMVARIPLYLYEAKYFEITSKSFLFYRATIKYGGRSFGRHISDCISQYYPSLTFLKSSYQN